MIRLLAGELGPELVAGLVPVGPPRPGRPLSRRPPPSHGLESFVKFLAKEN